MRTPTREGVDASVGHARARVSVAATPSLGSMGNATPAGVIALQRAAGNRATAAMLGGAASAPLRAMARCTGTCTCGGKCHAGRPDEELEALGGRAIGRSVMRRQALQRMAPCPPSLADSDPRDPGWRSDPDGSHLQTSAGNRAATQVVGRLLQREPVKAPPAKKPTPKPPTTAERLRDLETRQTALEKRTAMLELDLRYRALFGERMSSYKGAVLRITGALDAAQDGFKKAQEDQARFEALATQLIIAAGAIGLAFGFEPLLSAGLGRLGRTATQIEKTIEFWENPVLQAAGSTANIYPLAKGGRDADVPADVRPMAFLTKNLEELEHHNQALERAFATRAGGIKAADNAKLDALDVSAWDAQYSSLLAGLNAACKGVEAMKSAGEVARILERYIWAGWIRAQAKTLVNMGRGVAQYPAGKPDPSKPLPPGVRYALDLGGYIEDRLNEIGVSKLAGVTLSGHWYSSNEPGDWQQRLLTWAWTYNEVIGVAPPK